MHIKHLTLFSPHVQAQSDFYATILGLDIMEQSQDSVSFRIGNSILKIEYKVGATPYHFAINIPCSKANEALKWLKPRVDILKDEGNEIQNFENWNAEAIYFYDSDKNIVEFIARKTLNNDTDVPFDTNQLLEVSEIGIPTTNLESVVNELIRVTNIAMYDGNLRRFCALGDEHGLFICIDKNVKDWFPTNDKAFESGFRLKMIMDEVNYEVDYLDASLSIKRA